MVLSIAATSTTHAQIVNNCTDGGDFTADECSIAEMAAAGVSGRINVGNAAFSVNASPGTVEDRRVKVTGYVAGSGRAGLRFEVDGESLLGQGFNNHYSYTVGAFTAPGADTVQISDVKVDFDYDEVFTGSGSTYMGHYLHGFVADGPLINPPPPGDKSVDFIAPDEASERHLQDVIDGLSFDTFNPPGAETLPVTLDWDDARSVGVIRIDIFDGGDQPGGLAKPGVAGWTVEWDVGNAGFAINAGLNDAWFDPDTAGQGFFIIAFPDIKLMFLSWFTYDTERPPNDVMAVLGEPGHRWLTAQGPYDGNTAMLDIVFTSGGVFDSAEPEVTNDASYGTITIEWQDCEKGTLTYNIPSLGLMGSIEISRITLDNVALCEELGS